MYMYINICVCIFISDAYCVTALLSPVAPSSGGAVGTCSNFRCQTPNSRARESQSAPRKIKMAPGN